MTINASAFSRSTSNLRLTLPCRFSPKKVTPGLNTPPQHALSDVSGRGRFRRQLSGLNDDENERFSILATSRVHFGTVPSNMDCSTSAKLTRCLQVQQVKHRKDP